MWALLWQDCISSIWEHRSPSSWPELLCTDLDNNFRNYLSLCPWKLFADKLPLTEYMAYCWIVWGSFFFWDTLSDTGSWLMIWNWWDVFHWKTSAALHMIEPLSYLFMLENIAEKSCGFARNYQHKFKHKLSTDFWTDFQKGEWATIVYNPKHSESGIPSSTELCASADFSTFTSAGTNWEWWSGQWLLSRSTSWASTDRAEIWSRTFTFQRYTSIIASKLPGLLCDYEYLTNTFM